MIVTRTEYHQLTSTFTYNVDNQEIIDNFGSLETFMAELYDCTDQFHEFIMEYDYDRDDDLWTDRKGGYEVDWDIVDDE